MGGTEARKRDKERTKKVLIEAALSNLARDGLPGLGINAIAQTAGVSKVLIYRYFGGIDGLLRNLAQVMDPDQTKAAHDSLAEMPHDMAPSRLVKELIRSVHTRLANDDLSRAFLSGQVSLTSGAIHDALEAFSRAREEAGVNTTRMLWDRTDGDASLPLIDIQAILAVIIAGVEYLTLRGEHVQVFNGVEIGSEAGWQRIADAFEDLMIRAEQRHDGTQRGQRK